jgi:hypothetical protein
MSSDFSQPQVLECPACGATLALPDADTFLCDYCGKRIYIPPELRPHKTEPSLSQDAASVAQAGPSESQSDGGALEVQPSAQKTPKLIFVISLAAGILLAGVMVFVVMLSVPTSQGSQAIQPGENVQLPFTPLPTSLPFANLTMVFGAEGDQAGQFDDARSIAVDSQGNIFVADYTSGRINKFDPQGNFLQLIQVGDPAANQDYYIPGIAADQQGNLYVATGGQILKYNAATGELILTIPDGWPEIYYDSVVVAPDGNLYATNGMAGADDVIILTPEGKLLAHWTDLIESINHDDPAMSLALAVNSTGRVYILSPFGNQVYSYNPDGSYNSSFGEEGDVPGQFDLSTGLIAATDQDDLIISDVYRVDLFDESGNYLNQTFTVDYQIAGGSIYGMALDANDDLYFITSGGKVLKYTMNYPSEND